MVKAGAAPVKNDSAFGRLSIIFPNDRNAMAENTPTQYIQMKFDIALVSPILRSKRVAQ